MHSITKLELLIGTQTVLSSFPTVVAQCSGSGDAAGTAKCKLQEKGKWSTSVILHTTFVMNAIVCATVVSNMGASAFNMMSIERKRSVQCEVLSSTNGDLEIKDAFYYYSFATSTRKNF